VVGTQLIASPQHCCHACGAVCPEVSVTYDLDHSPGDIFLFPNMKGSLIRHQFESGEEIHQKTLVHLTHMSSELYVECWENQNIIGSVVLTL